MKRFSELIADIRESYPADDFFADFEKSCRSEPNKKKHYRSYNDALMMLDDESWNILKGKAVEHFGDEREGQRKQGFFNHLNESFAYRHLLRCGFNSVRFMKEGRQKSPDIRFVHQGTESYCEVKTVGISDDEIKRRSSNMVYGGEVYLNLSLGFKNKLAANIARAWDQIHSLGEHGLVYILVRFDDISSDYYLRNREQLIEFCRSQDFRNVFIKVGHRGNRRVCI